MPAAAGPLLALAALGLALRALTRSGPPDLHERGSYALLVGAALLLAMAFAPWTDEPGVETHFMQDTDSFSGGLARVGRHGRLGARGHAVGGDALRRRRDRARGPRRGARRRRASERLGRRAAVLAAAGAAVALSPWLTWAHLEQPVGADGSLVLNLDGWIVLGRTGWLLLLGGALIALERCRPPPAGVAILPAGDRPDRRPRRDRDHRRRLVAAASASSSWPPGSSPRSWRCCGRGRALPSEAMPAAAYAGKECVCQFQPRDLRPDLRAGHAGHAVLHRVPEAQGAQVPRRRRRRDRAGEGRGPARLRRRRDARSRPRRCPSSSGSRAEGSIAWERREYAGIEDLDKTFIVIACTDSTDTNIRIYDDAEQRAMLVNIVDVPPLCNFILPAIVRTGPLAIAISTAGASPALAKRMKREISELFGEEYARLAVMLNDARGWAKGTLPTYQDRKEFFEGIVNGDPDPIALLRAGDERAVLDLIAAAQRTHAPA